jgi:hypothetical protein
MVIPETPPLIGTLCSRRCMYRPHAINASVPQAPGVRSGSLALLSCSFSAVMHENVQLLSDTRAPSATTTVHPSKVSFSNVTSQRATQHATAPPACMHSMHARPKAGSDAPCAPSASQAPYHKLSCHAALRRCMIHRATCSLCLPAPSCPNALPYVSLRHYIHIWRVVEVPQRSAVDCSGEARICPARTLSPAGQASQNGIDLLPWLSTNCLLQRNATAAEVR